MADDNNDARAYERRADPPPDLEVLGRRLVGTWVSPVYYAPEGYATFYWVSSPEATHSRNIAARPDVGIVIFDSRTPVDSGQGVYVRAIAQELTDADLDRGIGIFSRRSESH